MPTTEASPGEAEPEAAEAAAPVLETARLRLRPPCPDDAPGIERLAGDWEVAKFTAAIPHPYPAGAAIGWIEQVTGTPTVGEPIWSIERRADGAFMGVIGLKRPAGPEGDDMAEVGFWIGRPFWRQGYATEALQAVLRHAFATIGLARMQATVKAENVASVRVQEKAGFVHVGEDIRPQPARGDPAPVEIRELRRGDWRG